MTNHIDKIINGKNTVGTYYYCVPNLTNLTYVKIKFSIIYYSTIFLHIYVETTM